MENTINTQSSEKKLTGKQFRALHYWFFLLAQELSANAIDMRAVLSELHYSIVPTKNTVKEILFKPLLKATFDKDSTKQLNKQKEIDQILDTIRVIFSDLKTDVVVPNFPSEQETEAYLKSLEI